MNTGDDLVLHGLNISPDLDIVTYTLAGAVNPRKLVGITRLEDLSPQLRGNHQALLRAPVVGKVDAVEAVPGRPTAQTYEVFTELSGRLDKQLAALNAILNTDVPAFNAQWLQPRGLAPIEKKPIPAE